jgi:hypothetical protein
MLNEKQDLTDISQKLLSNLIKKESILFSILTIIIANQFIMTSIFLGISAGIKF